MVTNRVDKILVTSGTQASTVAAATAGQYVVLVDGESNNTPITDELSFRVALKKADGSVKYSDTIKGRDIKSVKVEPYQAVVEQVSTVLFTTPVAGLEYRLSIVDRSDKEILQRRQDKRTYQVIAAEGETAATLATKFRDSINSDQDAPVSATVSTATLTLTAKAKVVTQNAAGQFGLQHYFEVGVTEVDGLAPYKKFGTVTQTVAPNFGSGTFAQVRELEQDTAGYEGFLNRTQFPVVQPSYDSVASATYNLIVIEYDNNYWSNSVVYGKVDSPITLVIASSGVTTALETIFAEYL